MENRKICYKCLIEDMDDKRLAESVRNMIDSISYEDRTPAEEYNRRLDICKRCESLISGTCIKCGCYVELRAAGKNRRCPDVKNKWKECMGEGHEN